MRFLAVFFLLIAIWQSVSVFFGTYLQRQAEVSLAQGVETQLVYQDLLLAHQLDARSPVTLKLLARTSPDDLSALSHLRQLTGSEPNDAGFWVLLLNVKARLGEFDQEMSTALVKASRLGPYEPGVQLDLIQFGSAHWLNLNSDMRTLVIDAGERAMTSRAPFGQRELLAALSESGLLSFVCHRLSESSACTSR